MNGTWYYVKQSKQDKEKGIFRVLVEGTFLPSSAKVFIGHIQGISPQGKELTTNFPFI